MTTQPHSHLARPPHKEPPAHAPNAALLIDFDNVTMGIRSDLQSELKRLLQSEIIRGKVAVQRAYADWRRYPQYIVPLSESSIDLIFAPAYGSNKKNATDIRLSIDALELVFTRPEIGTFILLSGDSDFSSLVLKLKEYGKYVIGVGIRESSSDLLIQNCDEYYSYNELAGLTKTSDEQYVRRDPWELVVEAVKQMTAHNDVMRSDRLKQVMQEIDPNFDEKDAGFSRFSKFVVEAARRGIIALTRLDNGQYEIALGPEVSGAAAQPSFPPAPEREERPHREGRERDRDRGDRGRGRGERRGGFSLSEAFNLLRQALGRIASAGEPVAADALRETMVELKGESAESLSPSRFPRLLRQAHDAEIIDLSKEEDGAYAVRLRPGGGPAVESDAAEPVAAVEEPMPATEELAERTVAAAPATGAPSAGVPASGPARGARFRRGSRGPRPATQPELPKLGVVEVDPNFRPRVPRAPVATPAPAAPIPAPVPAERTGPAAEGSREGRGGRGRRGGRGGRGRGRGGSEGNGEPRGERHEPRNAGHRPDRDGGEGGGRHRGGRGRGRGGRPVEEAGSERPPLGPPIERAPVSPEPRREPVRPAAPPPDAAEPEQESFWSRVKRGLTGS